MSCNITPDKDPFEPKYVLVNTILDFEMKLLMGWERDHSGNKNHVKKKFDLFCSCLQGIAPNKWDLCTVNYEGDTPTEKGFTNCVKDYLEAVDQCTNLSDQVICLLCLKSKPEHIQFEEFLNCRTQIL